MTLYAFLVALVLGAGWFGYEEWKKKESEAKKIAEAQNKTTPINAAKQTN